MLKKQKLQVIHSWYPKAITTIDCMNKVIDYFENELEIDPASVMLADSICSDDVNSIQYPYRAQEFLGPFKLGGLNGLPFVGLSGMAAMASHVPDNGAVFIYYGPHIGITKDGEIGEIGRIGQKHNSTCCGAAQIALAKLKNNEIEDGTVNHDDYQMNTIEQVVFKQKDKILNAKTPIFETTEVVYQEIEQKIYELVQKTNFSCRYIVMLGGIVINSDSDMGSFLSIKKCELLDAVKNEIIDLTEKL